MQASLYTCACYKIDDFIEGSALFKKLERRSGRRCVLFSQDLEAPGPLNINPNSPKADCKFPYSQHANPNPPKSYY